jgi:hypothetical protein
LADRGYDTNSILEHVERQGISAVIPSKRNRKVQRAYDNLQSASPGGECFSPFEEMARDRNQIREQRGLSPCSHPYQAHFPMGINLMTTLPSTRPVRTISPLGLSTNTQSSSAMA